MLVGNGVARGGTVAGLEREILAGMLAGGTHLGYRIVSTGTSQRAPGIGMEDTQ